VITETCARLQIDDYLYSGITKAMTLLNFFRLLCWLCVTTLVSLTAISQNAAPPDLCKSVDSKVLSAKIVLVKCGNDVSQLSFVGDLYIQTTTAITKLPVALIISPSRAGQWLIVTLNGTGGSLEIGKKYILDLSSSSPVSESSIEFDTSPKLTLTASLVSKGSRRYEATSTLAFADAKGNILVNSGTVDKHPCAVAATDNSGSSAAPISATCDLLTPAVLEPVTHTIAFASLDPDTVGTINIVVGNLTAAQNSLLRLTPQHVLLPNQATLASIFGKPFTFDSKSKFAASQKIPTSKDASQYYVLFSGSAGVGTTPAWVLDAKIAPLLPLQRNDFQFAPLVLANVGQGTVKGQTYTNTIDFGGTAQKLFLLHKDLQGLLFSAGPTYETDKQFDKDNLLAVLDLKYYFKGLYQPQTSRTLQQYYAFQQTHKTWQLDQQPPALWGYILDFHTGIETGGALVDTTVKASTGNATQKVPTYPIFRVVPQVHALIQWWWFSVDATAVPRYLATTEYTVIQLKNNSLVLKPVTGWNALGTVTGTLSPTGWAGHFGITVSYKDGFAPPTFIRINAVQYGISFKY
jgi:hypothetical protein